MQSQPSSSLGLHLAGGCEGRGTVCASMMRAHVQLIDVSNIIIINHMMLWNYSSMPVTPEHEQEPPAPESLTVCITQPVVRFRMIFLMTS